MTELVPGGHTSRSAAWNSNQAPPSVNLFLTQALPKVLDSTPYAFSLELAALAGWRGALGLEKWAAEHMARDSVQFVTALLAFLEVRTAVRVHVWLGGVG